MASKMYASVFKVNRLARATILLIVSFIFVFYVWATTTALDEVVRGSGRIIPSGQTQMVQNLEGGLVDEIFVSAGDVVEKGDILIRIDDTGVYSSYQEQREKYFSIEVRLQRLIAEMSDNKPVFDMDVLKDAGEYIENEMNLYHAQKRERSSTIQSFENQIQRKEKEIKELEGSRKKIQDALQLLDEEMALTEPLAAKNIVPQVDVLSLKRQINEMRRELDAVAFNKIKTQSDIAELSEKISNYKNVYKRKLVEEIADLKKQKGQISATIKASVDRVNRTTVRAPVKGTVKQVMVNTLGGVVKPGMDLVEILPLEDNLVVEAEIRPQDIAFIRPNQTVRVKLTAYDYAIYGGLDAKLTQLSADSIENDDGERVYIIKVQTERNYLGSRKNPLPIMPGMVAEVDIKTGKKTVWDYLVKPILAIGDRALRER